MTKLMTKFEHQKSLTRGEEAAKISKTSFSRIQIDPLVSNLPCKRLENRLSVWG